MIYSVEQEIKEIKFAYENNEISWDSAIDEVRTVAKLEGDDVREAVRYFENICD
ncbi:hypothetical protein [Holdemanella biformis]